MLQQNKQKKDKGLGMKAHQWLPKSLVGLYDN